MTTEDGKVNNFAHMVVDLHFMSLAKPMIPVAGHRITEVDDPIGDVPLRLGGVYWAEGQRPVAAVVVVGFDAPFPRACDDDWFDDQVIATMGDNAARILNGGYDRVVFQVQDGDMINAIMENGVPGPEWVPGAA